MDKSTSSRLVVRTPNVLSTLEGVQNTFSVLLEARHLNLRKVGTQEMRLVFGDKIPEAVDALRGTLELLSRDDAMRIWNRCKARLKHELLVPDSTNFSMNLYNKLELGPDFAARAYLSHFHRVIEAPYGNRFVSFDQNFIYRFVHFLKELPLLVSRDIVRSMNKKVMYLIFWDEIQEFERYDDIKVYSLEESTSWLRNGAPPDMDLTPFLFWLWENDFDLYQDSLREFFKEEYPEERELFHEVLERTNRWNIHQDQFKRKDKDDVARYLDT